MIERAALLRRKAALLAELAQLELELAALEEQDPAHAVPVSKPRRPRLVRMAPQQPVPPVTPPSDLDRARARRDLARLGHVSGRSTG